MPGRNLPVNTTRSVVHVDALQLQVGVSVIRTGGINAVLITDHLPELRTDLVAALATLDVHELTHGAERKRLRSPSEPQGC